MKKLSSKQIFEAAKKTAVPTLVRGASLVGAAYVANKIIPDKFPDYDTKYVGPIFTGLGIVAEVLGDIMYPKNAIIRSVAQGVSSYGMLAAAGTYLMPDKKEELGLSGADLGAPFSVVDYMNVRKEVPVAEIDPLNGINGNDDDDHDLDLVDALRQQNTQMMNAGYNPAAMNVPARMLNPANNLNGTELSGAEKLEELIADQVF